MYIVQIKSKKQVHVWDFIYSRGGLLSKQKNVEEQGRRNCWVRMESHGTYENYDEYREHIANMRELAKEVTIHN